MSLTLAGMYNVPSFTLARAVGGVFGWYWIKVLKRPSTPVIVMASVRKDTPIFQTTF